MSEEKCCGLMGRIFGHDIDDVFEDEKSVPTISMSEQMMYGRTAAEIANIIEASCPTKDRYIHSVCRRCGIVVSRKSPLS